jgi:hypothetical protein
MKAAEATGFFLEAASNQVNLKKTAFAEKLKRRLILMSESSHFS